MDHYSCKRRFRQRSCIALLLGALAAQAGEPVGPPAAAEEGEIGAQPAAESPLGEAEESSPAAVVERAAGAAADSRAEERLDDSPGPASEPGPGGEEGARTEPSGEAPAPIDVAQEATPAVTALPMGPPVPDDLDHLHLLGSRIEPGSSARLSWSPGLSFAGIAMPTPVLAVNGARPGPTLCLTAAIHGDELNGIEIVRRLIHDLDVGKLRGAIIGVPIVNLQGFQRASRYLADRRDLNRYFPGHPEGSVAARIAHSFFAEIVQHCDALVDLHTGSFHRSNLPQIRANLHHPAVKALSQKFGATAVLHSTGSSGTLRRAATDAGVPAVTIEAGEPLRLQDREVSHGVKSLRSLLDQLDMYSRFSLWGDPEPVYYQSRWIRANRGGILLSEVKLGARVDRDALLGRVVDPITNEHSEIRAPFAGRVLGMAVNQVVMPGYAAYHLGVRAEPASLTEEDGAATMVEPLPLRQEVIRQDAPGEPDGDPDEDSEE